MQGLGRLAAGVGLIMAASAAWAQEPDEARTDVVVITGVGPARAGAELIASTTVLGQEDVIERLSGGLGDTLAGLPGVSTSAFGPGASRPLIRGLGAERVQVLTNGIGVIDASSASPDHAVTGDPLGAERIEILRGPATLAYGGGAAGGVINVIDGLIAEALPDARVSALGYAGYTSADEGAALAGRATMAAGPAVAVLLLSRRHSEDLDIPGFAESARLRAMEEDEGAAHEHVEGMLENSGVESRTASLGLSLVGDSAFAGISGRRLETKYGLVGGHAHEHDHEHDEEDHAAAFAAAPLAIGIADAGERPEAPFIDLKQTRVDIRGGFRLDDGPIARFTTAVSVVDYVHAEFEGPGEPGTVFANTGYEARAEAEHAKIAGVSGSFGVQASKRDFEAVGHDAFVTPTVTRQAGVFAFETLERGGWGVEAGLRVDEVRHDNAVESKRSFRTFNASLGVHGHASPDLFLGLSLNRTERAPNDVELFAGGPHLATRSFEIGDPSLTTEKGLSLEGGARWQAGPLELELTVYRFAFEDFIYLDPTGAVADGLPVFQAMQADATFAGAELGLALELGEAMGAAWRLDGSADLVRGELDAGASLPRIPPASAMVGIEAEAGILEARLEARWAGDRDDVADFELPTDGWTAIDLRTTIKVAPGLELILEGANLADEEIRHHASPLKDVAPMAGRSFRIGARAAF